MSSVRRVLWITLGLNALVATAKLACGIETGLIAMVADGVHSLLDGSSNVVGLVAIHHAVKPPDADHPYGHRKLETFASLGIGVLLVLACQEILGAAWGRLRHGGAAEANVLSFVVMIVTMGVNLFVAWYERREGLRLRSELLIADSAHTKSDILVSVTVIAALAASKLGYGIVDVVATLLIVAWIARIAWLVVRPAVSTLSDEARLDPAEIETLAMAVPGVRNVHRIRTRGHEHHVWVDMHVQVDPDVTVRDAHEVASHVESAIQAKWPDVVDVTTHLEPHGDPIEGLDGAPIGEVS